MSAFFEKMIHHAWTLSERLNMGDGTDNLNCTIGGGGQTTLVYTLGGTDNLNIYFEGGTDNLL